MFCFFPKGLTWQTGAASRRLPSQRGRWLWIHSSGDKNNGGQDMVQDHPSIPRCSSIFQSRDGLQGFVPGFSCCILYRVSHHAPGEPTRRWPPPAVRLSCMRRGEQSQIQALDKVSTCKHYQLVMLMFGSDCCSGDPSSHLTQSDWGFDYPSGSHFNFRCSS